MEDLYQVIGGKIRDVRSKRRLTQAAIADRLNLSRSSVTHIENGYQAISLIDLYKLAEALAVDIAELLPTRRELAHSPKPPMEKIDTDPRFSEREKKELKRVVNSLQRNGL